MTFALVLAAKPWFYWLGPVLVLGAVVGVIALLIGYYVKVVQNKYPRQ
jgi:hypothetical protein